MMVATIAMATPHKSQTPTRQTFVFNVGGSAGSSWAAWSLFTSRPWLLPRVGGACVVTQTLVRGACAQCPLDAVHARQ